MEDDLIKKTFKEMKKGLPETVKCPEQVDLALFSEGIMDEEEADRIAEHLFLCSKCCDYMVSLSKITYFSAEERLPDVAEEQLEQVSALVKDREREFRLKGISDSLVQAAQFTKELFNFDWIRQPIPVAIKSAALALLVVLMVSTTYFYYQEKGDVVPLSVQMEVIGKVGVISKRGIPEASVERILKEGDTLYSNDYCRINFKLARDAYAYVVYYDSKGRLHQLYPDPALSIPHKVRGNRKYTIPPEEGNWFKLDDSIGTETVFVLASDKPISGLKETIPTRQGLNVEEVVKILKRKATEIKVFSFKHQ